MGFTCLSVAPASHIVQLLALSSPSLLQYQWPSYVWAAVFIYWSRGIYQRLQPRYLEVSLHFRRSAIQHLIQKRHAVIFDLAICLGIPPINVALSMLNIVTRPESYYNSVITVYIPQDHRFSILEDFGCSSSVGITSVSLLLGGVPQVLVSFGCAVYSSLFIQYSSIIPRPDPRFVSSDPPFSLQAVLADQ